jgi:hypothetical protein
MANRETFSLGTPDSEQNQYSVDLSQVQKPDAAPEEPAAEKDTDTNRDETMADRLELRRDQLNFRDRMEADIAAAPPAEQPQKDQPESVADRLDLRKEQLDLRDRLEASGAAEAKSDQLRQLTNETIPRLQAADSVEDLVVAFDILQSQGVKEFGGKAIKEIVDDLASWTTDEAAAINRMDDDALRQMIDTRMPLLGGMREKAFDLLRPSQVESSAEVTGKSRYDVLDAEFKAAMTDYEKSLINRLKKQFLESKEFDAAETNILAKATRGEKLVGYDLLLAKLVILKRNPKSLSAEQKAQIEEDFTNTLIMRSGAFLNAKSAEIEEARRKFGGNRKEPLVGVSAPPRELLKLLVAEEKLKLEGAYRRRQEAFRRGEALREPTAVEAGYFAERDREEAPRGSSSGSTPLARAA